MKKKQLVCLVLTSGDTVIGRYIKEDPFSVMINYSIKLTSLSRPESTMFIKHNLIGKSDKVTYYKAGIVTIYPVTKFIETFYEKAKLFMEKNLESTITKEFSIHIEAIDKAMKPLDLKDVVDIINKIDQLKNDHDSVSLVKSEEKKTVH